MNNNYNYIDIKAIIEKFVRKRRFFRKISSFSIIGLLVYALTAQHFFSYEITGPFSGQYTTVVLIWILWNMALSHYISYKLSICPICHIVIPTVQNHKTGQLSAGNGPLPDYCPYCGTSFHDK